MAIVSGMPVKSGTYFNSTRFTFAQVQDGESLKGGAGDRWVRVPLPLAVAAAPVLGGLFVVVLPVLGLAAVALGLARKLSGGVKDGAADLAANLVSGPVPGAAHLTGKAGKPAETPAAAGAAKDPAALQDLARKIEEKRRG